MYIDGCRYSERLNTETGGSKTPLIHGVVLVILVLVVTQQETVGLSCRPGQTLKKPKYLSVCDREERESGEGDVCMCERVA